MQKSIFNRKEQNETVGRGFAARGYRYKDPDMKPKSRLKIEQSNRRFSIKIFMQVPAFDFTLYDRSNNFNQYIRVI